VAIILRNVLVLVVSFLAACGGYSCSDPERMRIKVEKRPDAPPLWSWKGLGEPVVTEISSGRLGGQIVFLPRPKKNQK